MRLMNSLSWLSSWFEPPERKPAQTQILTRPGAEPHPPTSSFCLLFLVYLSFKAMLTLQTNLHWNYNMMRNRTATCRHRGCSASSAFISAVVQRHPAFPSTPARPLWKQPEPSPVDGVGWIRQGVVLPACRLCPNVVFLIYANSEARGRWGQGS